MIMLERAVPEKLTMLQCAIRRGFTHLEEDLLKIEAGYAGERYVDLRWQDMNLQIKHALFQDYSIQLGDFSYQMDTVFVCQHFILILEIKNIVGEIHVDNEKHQFIRIKPDGTREGFRNPVDQVKRHARVLRQLIENPIPIEYAVVFSNSKAIIGKTPRNEPIFHVSGLETYVRRLISKYSVHLNHAEFDRVLDRFQKYYSPLAFQFQIDKNKMIKGVLCSQCSYKRKMYFQHGKFECANCRYRSNMPLREALFDYYILVGEWITNKEFRDFVGIESSDAAKRLLQSLNVTCQGTNKGRRYKIADIFQESLIK
ncbi:MAG: nuclease-related domain-containing protein [Lysinibacillus sp.]